MTREVITLSAALMLMTLAFVGALWAMREQRRNCDRHSATWKRQYDEMTAMAIEMGVGVDKARMRMQHARYQLSQGQEKWAVQQLEIGMAECQQLAHGEREYFTLPMGAPPYLPSPNDAPRMS